MSARVSNQDVPRLVAYRDAFKTNNETVFSHTYTGGFVGGEPTNVYVVYSYGRHFPMAAYFAHDDCWLVNESKYSSTTSRHQSLVRRGIAMNPKPTAYVTTSELEAALYYGRVNDYFVSVDDLRLSAKLASALAPVLSLTKGEQHEVFA